MEILTITVNVIRPEGSRKDFGNARLAFWDDYARASDLRSGLDFNIEEFARSSEQNLRRRLPSVLHHLLVNALVRDDDKAFRSPRTASAIQILPARLIVSIQEIRYGSMSVDLGLPDLDAFAELVGNNSDTFEAVFAAYIPDAFHQALPGNTDHVAYKVTVPKSLQYALEKTAKPAISGEPEPTAKEKGAAILGSLVRSPLIFPVILICFLWFYARQDALEERRLTSEMIQTLVTQQTVVIGLLKDKSQEASNNSGMATDAGALKASTITKPGKRLTKSGKEKEQQ